MNGLLNCIMCIYNEINLIDYIIECVFFFFIIWIIEKIDYKFKYIFVLCICIDL